MAVRIADLPALSTKDESMAQQAVAGESAHELVTLALRLAEEIANGADADQWAIAVVGLPQLGPPDFEELVPRPWLELQNQGRPARYRMTLVLQAEGKDLGVIRLGTLRPSGFSEIEVARTRHTVEQAAETLAAAMYEPDGQNAGPRGRRDESHLPLFAVSEARMIGNPTPIHILVAYYSRFGAVERLAKCVAEGVQRVENTSVELLKIEDQPIDELRPGEDENAMLQRRAATVNRLTMANALIVGSPGYFGGMAAAVHRLFEDCATAAVAPNTDRTRPWRHYLFKDKIGGAFAATGTPHGGNEQTLLSILTMFMHFGMIPVTPGQQQPILENESAPYGATTISGPTGDRSPTPDEEEQARRLGQRVAEVTTWIVTGATAWAADRDLRSRVRGGNQPL